MKIARAQLFPPGILPRLDDLSDHSFDMDHQLWTGIHWFLRRLFRPGAESLRGLFEMADQRWRIDIQLVLIRGFLLVSVADLHLLLLAY